MTSNASLKESMLKEGAIVQSIFLFILSIFIMLSGSAYGMGAFDDYEPFHIPASSIPAEIDLPEWSSNPSDEQLSDYVQALASSDFIKADLSDAEWSVSVCAGGYTVKATVNGSNTYAFVFLPDGQLAAYQSGIPHPPVSQILEPHRGFGDEIAIYALAFLDEVAPAVNNPIECFSGEALFDHDGCISGSIHGVTYVGSGEKRTAAYFTVEIEPTLRLSSYRLEPAILQHLWAQNTFSPAMEPDFRITHEFPPQKKEKGTIVPDLITAEELYPSVVNHLKTEYQETDESLRRFDVECELMAEGEPYYWSFHLVTCEFYGDELDDYQVKVNALTGEIMDAAAYEEGNG